MSAAKKLRRRVANVRGFMSVEFAHSYMQGARVVVDAANADYIDGRATRGAVLVLKDMHDALALFDAARRAVVHFREAKRSEWKMLDAVLKEQL